jgi:hypothetical protein
MLKMALLILVLVSASMFAAHAYDYYRTRDLAPYVFDAEPAPLKTHKTACQLKSV